MKKTLLFLLCGLISLYGATFVNPSVVPPAPRKLSVVGGGIVGTLESYYAYKDAEKNGEKLSITIYEKGDSFGSTNTSYNIVPSLTIDEILSVVPRGSELINKLAIPFNQPGGIRVDDIHGVNDCPSATRFIDAVGIYGSDTLHDDRTLTLLTLGKKSMDLWQEMYDEGDDELKAILEASNFNPCREPKNTSAKHLHDGYRVDLIYGIPNAEARALNMKADYEKLGYVNCSLLSPEEVATIDPYLADFCKTHSEDGVWTNDCTALWRPGGCIDTRAFLPKMSAYLQKVMGDSFQHQFGKEVIGVEMDANAPKIVGLQFSDGTSVREEAQYIFAPGESVGTLQKLGFNEPAYAGFAGSSLLITIPLKDDQIEQYKNFSHCMEVHNEGIVLAWQARFKDNAIFIGVAGTKAFYADIEPNKDEAFATNRNLVQLNMVNQVLPEFVSLALNDDTSLQVINSDQLSTLEENGIARRWVGRRAVAYDGFPTIGALYFDGQQVSNARCTTHLGSGGVSFGPGAVFMSRNSEQNSNDPFVQKTLLYADSRRTAE